MAGQSRKMPWKTSRRMTGREEVTTMTVKDIAQHIGCSPQLIRSAAQRGAIDYVTYIPPRRKYGYGRYIVYPEKAKAALGIKGGEEEK